MKKLVARGWGAPQAHRFLWQLVHDLSSLRGEEQVDALRKLPRAGRSLLQFCYGNHDIDLPTTGTIDYDPIPTAAYSEAPELGDEDIIAREAPKLRTLFAVGAHATLTSARRLQLWRDILERATREDRELLDIIRTERVIPGITRAAVAEAFGSGFLEEPPAPAEPVPEITYDFRTEPDRDAPVVLEPCAAPEPTRAPTADELRYAALMARMGW